jgi:hypothetical protein
MNQLGRPTELSEELFAEIRRLVLNSKNMKETAEILDIPYNTMSKWSSDNFGSFADKWLLYEQERKLQKAEGRIEDLINSKDEKVSLQASIFVAETLGKDRGYSKRQELTGRNARDLIPKTLSELEKTELRNLLV